jgi:hypothetical protein
MRKVSLLLVALAALQLPACGTKANPQELIVGKWESTDASNYRTAEFTQDGSVSLPTAMGLQGNGGYKFTDKDYVEFDIGLGGARQKYKAKVAVTKDTLSLSYEKGEPQTFKRLK